MKTHKALLTLIAFSSLTAFVFNTTNNNSGKLKTVHNYLSNKDRTYIYLPDGRLSSTEDTYFERISYDYAGDSIVYWHWFNNNRQWVTDTLILNEKGLIETSISGDKVTKYKYNNINYCTAYDTYKRDKLLSSAKMKIENSNEVERIYTRYGKTKKDKPEVYRHYYQYSLAQTNNLTHQNTGIPFWGAISKNVLTRFIALNEKGDTIKNETYTYQFDTLGRMLQMSHHFTNGQISDSVGYTYY